MTNIRNFLGVIPFLFAMAGNAAAAPVQWSSANGGNDHYYEFVSTVGTCGNLNGYDCINWDQALAASASRSHLGMAGYLATETSYNEALFIRNLVNLVNFGGKAWLAGSDRDSDGVWTWEAGPENGQTFTTVVGHVAITCDPCLWVSPFSGLANDPVANYLLTGATPFGVDWRISTLDGTFNGIHYVGSIVGYVVEYSAAQGASIPAPGSLILVALGLAALRRPRRPVSEAPPDR